MSSRTTKSKPRQPAPAPQLAGVSPELQTFITIYDRLPRGDRNAINAVRDGHEPESEIYKTAEAAWTASQSGLRMAVDAVMACPARPGYQTSSQPRELRGFDDNPKSAHAIGFGRFVRVGRCLRCAPGLQSCEIAFRANAGEDLDVEAADSPRAADLHGQTVHRHGVAAHRPHRHSRDFRSLGDADALGGDGAGGRKQTIMRQRHAAAPERGARNIGVVLRRNTALRPASRFWPSPRDSVAGLVREG